MECPSKCRGGSSIEKEKGKTSRSRGIYMLRAKARHTAEGGGGGLVDFKLESGFIGKIWYVISTPILDCLLKMLFTEDYLLTAMASQDSTRVETCSFRGFSPLTWSDTIKNIIGVTG